MDDIKRQNFKASHPEVVFPQVRHLQPHECDQVRTEIAVKLNLPTKSSHLELLKEIDYRAHEVIGFRPSNKTFSLVAVLKELQINATALYINWQQFDDIDEITVSDLDRWFHDFWYPDSDDLELFDSSLNWILLIKHFDVIKMLKT